MKKTYRETLRFVDEPAHKRFFVCSHFSALGSSSWVYCRCRGGGSSGSNSPKSYKISLQVARIREKGNGQSNDFAECVSSDRPPPPPTSYIYLRSSAGFHTILKLYLSPRAVENTKDPSAFGLVHALATICLGVYGCHMTVELWEAVTIALNYECSFVE